MNKHIYFFGWPSDYGGADTKAAHLFALLAGYVEITVVPNHVDSLKETKWTTYLDELGIKYAAADSLPKRLNGVALTLCNVNFFGQGICKFATERGLPIVWSSEMSWHLDQEVAVIKGGQIARLLYVSEAQKSILNYESFCDVPTRMTGNYIDPSFFPFHDRAVSERVTIGRLSRADPFKYPDRFPETYESLEVPHANFRVMAWDSRLAKLYQTHAFDERWELLEKGSESTVKFLQSLDLFVYDLGPKCTESWGRSTVEAMLTGAIPIVPKGHHFHELILDGETGFICQTPKDFREHAQQLAGDQVLRKKMSRACRDHAESKLCNAEEHRKIWLEALDV